jgi:hypothetical protein
MKEGENDLVFEQHPVMGQYVGGREIVLGGHVAQKLGIKLGVNLFGYGSQG